MAKGLKFAQLCNCNFGGTRQIVQFGKGRAEVTTNIFDISKFIYINLAKNINFFCCTGQSGIQPA